MALYEYGCVGRGVFEGAEEGNSNEENRRQPEHLRFANECLKLSLQPFSLLRFNNSTNHYALCAIHCTHSIFPKFSATVDSSDSTIRNMNV